MDEPSTKDTWERFEVQTDRFSKIYSIHMKEGWGGETSMVPLTTGL